MVKNKYQSTMPENAFTVTDKKKGITVGTITVFSVCILPGTSGILSSVYDLHAH